MEANKNLTSEQMFRFELLERFSNVSAAKEAYEFITQKDEPLVSDIDWYDYKPHRPNQYMPDGVYFICEDGACALVNAEGSMFEASPTFPIGVGLKIGCFSIKIAAKDIDCGHIPLIVKSLDVNTKRCLKRKEAVMDLSGRRNTDNMKDVLFPKIELTDGWYIPSLGELLRIFLYRCVIDEALLIISGAPFKDQCYWTSTSKNCICNYVVSMWDGAINDLNACDTMNMVRMVSKFL